MHSLRKESSVLRKENRTGQNQLAYLSLFFLPVLLKVDLFHCHYPIADMLSQSLVDSLRFK